MLRVMLIDDEPSVLIGLRLLLDWDAHDAEICGAFQHPDQALEAAVSLQPDLIITDIEMPEISGLDLIVSLKTVCPNTTCIILSAYSDFSYAQRAVELGVYRYLLKPLAADTLSKLLQEVKEKIAYRKPSEQSLMRRLVAKEILLNGTEFHHSNTLPAFRDLAQQHPFRLVFLKPRDSEPDLAALQQQVRIALEMEYAFRHGSELLLLLDESCADTVCDVLDEKFPEVFTHETTPTFIGLMAGHELLMQRQTAEVATSAEALEESSAVGNTQQAVQKAMAFIREHYMEHDFRLASVSEALYMNNSYLSHIFKQRTGTTLYQYLLDIRMLEAKKLLSDSGLTVAEIGYRVGYAIPKNFYSAFKKYYNESPRSYQKRNLHNK